MQQEPKKKHEIAGAEEAPSDQTSGGEELAAETSSFEIKKQSILGHIRAFRKVIVISVASIVGAFAVVFFGFSKQLVGFLTFPINARGIELIYISLYETFIVELKLSLIAGIILVSPVIIWQIWGFIRPALYPDEKRTVTRIFFVTLVLFLAGALFGYLIVFQMAITFFLAYNEGLAAPFISIERYTTFLVSFLLPFGLAFQLPVVMVVLVRKKIVSIIKFKKCRKFIIFGIIVISALLTPPDGISMVMLAAPLILLFELGLIVARLGKKQESEDDSQPATDNNETTPGTS